MPDADPAHTWSAWFRAALDASGISQAEIADILGMTTGNISKWYTGKGYAPRRIEDVIAVAHALRQSDATEALEAAGMARAAALIRAEIDNAEEHPMIARIRNERVLTAAQRDQLEAEFRRTQAETIHYFELRLAEAQRRYRTEHDGRTRSKSGETDGDETRAML
jgi:transcriptional regulator with XRE-family HTH domain